MTILDRRSVAALLGACAITTGLIAPAGAAAQPLGARAHLASAGGEREEERAHRREEREQARAQRREERQRAREERQREREQGRSERRDDGKGLGGSETAHAHCRLTAQASSARIVAGATVTLSGQLSCPEASEQSEQQVTVYRSGGGAPRSVLGTATTAADGSFQFEVAGLEENSMLSVRAGRAHGARAAVKVAPRVTISDPLAGSDLASAATRGSGRWVTFEGSAGARYAGTRVALQVSYAPTEEQWSTVGFGRIDAQGDYSVRHAFRSPGETWVRVVVRPRPGFTAAASEPFAYDVVGPQNPKLSIQVSSPLVPFGSSVTISGVGAPGEAVTLYSRDAAGALSEAGSTTTNAAGEYSFTAEPQASTDYFTRQGTETSSVLPERVDFALSPATPPVSATAGQPVTLTGTLAPAKPGEQVLLERQNASGVGFRPLAYGTVEGSSFTIAHTFEEAGSYVLRIRVQGVPGLRSTAGAPFTLQVAPPASE